jgi:beta-1,4-mannosyltransferase
MRILAWPIKTDLNPYTGLVYSNLPPEVQAHGWPANLLRKYEIWHVHWPDALLGIPSSAHATYKVSGMFAAMDFLRARGTKVVWTMHNFASHEARHPKLEAWFWRRFIPRVDGAISLSAAGLALALERFPRFRNIPTTVIPHGHYREQYPATNEDGRRRLGIPPNAKVIMFFGAVRSYKNVDVLVRAFRGVKNEGALLYILGNPNSHELAETIKTEAAKDSRVHLKFEFVDANNVSAYLGAADLIVLPYREVLNSGSALLALSCSRPVLVPDRGAMGELRSEFSDAWVRTYKGSLESSTLESALEWASQPRPEVCPMPEKYFWNHIGAETVRFYETVLSQSQDATQPALARE